MRRVTFFNRVYAPNAEATAVYLTELVEGLAGRCDVTVVCNVPGPASPGVVRVCSPWHSRRGALAKLLNYPFCLVVALAHLLLRTPRDAVAVLWSDPPFMDVVLGAVARLQRRPYVIVLQDVFARHLVRRLPGLSAFYRAVERYAFGAAEAVVCISSDTADLMRANGVANTRLVRNWVAHADRLAPVPGARARRYGGTPVERRVILKYAGNVGFACDLDAFERMLARLDVPDDFLFVFQASGRRMAQVRQLAAAHANVVLVDPVPVGELAASLCECDAHLIMTPDPLYGIVFPSKLGGILACGMPVVASAPRRSELHDLLAVHDVGLSAPADDPGAFAAALADLRVIVREKPERRRAMSDRAVALAAAWSRRDGVEAYAALLSAPRL